MPEAPEIGEAHASKLADIDGVNEQIKHLLPELLAARKAYCRDPSEAKQKELEAVEERAELLRRDFGQKLAELQQLAGLSDEFLEGVERQRREARYDNRLRLKRHEFTSDNVASDRSIDELLPVALDRILSCVDQRFLAAEVGAEHRLSQMWTGESLSLVKGVRPESETPTIHRFLQAVRVSQDFLEGNPYYDHFAGALLVPQMAALGGGLEDIAEVGGDTDGRIRNLWTLPSSQSDSVAFELLVATACATTGLKVEFLPADAEKSPDLRCHDPIPMVIECKRKRVLSDYEILEETTMRAIFDRLDKEARSRGIWGRFELRLTVDHAALPLDEVVRCLIRQRLAARPERPLAFPWGTVSYCELPRRFRIDHSRVYAPKMLKQAFGWESDLPEWDGIVCRVAKMEAQFIDEISEATALLWSNYCDRAVIRRSWSPLDAYGNAMHQIPPGEFGIVYLAYQEGARAEIADRRFEEFQKRMREWEHTARIRVPVSFLNRLYPRPLVNGSPDLIESAVVLRADYVNPELADAFPGMVFGRR
jgi:hypothetical protein